MPIMGMQTSQAKELDEKAERGNVVLEKIVRKELTGQKPTVRSGRS